LLQISELDIGNKDRNAEAKKNGNLLAKYSAKTSVPSQGLAK
jgi:hypothetical protein